MLKVLPGESFPLGATVYPQGVNFCIFSENATAVRLLLFDRPDASQPTETIRLDPQLNKTFYYWHVFIPGLKAGQIYAYRVNGQYDPEEGHRFDNKKVLLDPYARAVVGDETYDRTAASKAGDNCKVALKGVVVDPSIYDWEGDRHPRIPYLQDLGITAVELLPVHQFDPQDVRPGLKNYWGYSTINFFSPHRGYSSRRDLLGAIDEFRDLVKALHRAGIEVILDVVFNHTAEGNEQGPTLSFRGIDNQVYYILDPENPAEYTNYSGCGNTIKGNHPVVSRLILDSLRYWVSEMHVDGFRFDLATILARNTFGEPIQPQTGMMDIISIIESDPVLAGTKLIAEAWDAAGLYGVGQFVELADWFAEWNGPFRDDVRRFIKSDPNMAETVAARILASPDIYSRLDTDINRSVNFITCHDGFTLNDLVSYNDKHNLANGEGNRDGGDHNFSWNCGEEGDSDDPEILDLRSRQIKNLLTILFMSQGTPMLLMGDEIRHTQNGNNNAYCQDNELSWFDWSLVEKNQGLLRFVQKLIHFIQGLEIFNQERFLKVSLRSSQPHLTWHGTRLYRPDWRENSHSLAFSVFHPIAKEYLYVVFNTYWKPLKFQLPLLEYGNHWHRIVDTALPTPDDFCELTNAKTIYENSYRVAPRSAIVLMAKREIIPFEEFSI